MLEILSQTQGIILLVVYGLLMIGLSLVFSYKRETDTAEFLLASRNIGVWAGAMSIAAAWIWAPALFISSQKAFEQGLAGAFWFIFPNILALLIFAPLALKIRKILPTGYTFPQFVKLRHGKGVHFLYMMQFLILQICSFAIQILAGSTLIHIVTGIPYVIIALILVTIVLVYSLIGGLRASITTDYLQMVLILGISSIIVPLVFLNSGGVETFVAGLGGFTGDFGNIFDPWVFYTFGIPTTIGLLAGPIGDQMHWQRAYSLKKDSDVIKTFVLAAVLFAIVPLLLSVLGFVGAGKVILDGWMISEAQMVGPITVSMLLPVSMLIIFVVMLLSGLLSTLDSVLCAIASLTVVDLFKPSKELSETGNDHDPKKVKLARMSMIIMAVLGLSIALIPGLKILHLFLFYATLRASTLVPTLMTILWSKLKSRAVFVSVLSSMIFGAPLMGLGAIIKNVHVSVASSLLTVIIGFLGCYILSKTIYKKDINPEKYAIQN